VNVINIINNKLCEFSINRFKEMGKKKSGLYGYYLNRAKKRMIISDTDIYLITYIYENIGKNKIICELAAGLAQTSIVLSKLGYQVNAYEIDSNRLKYAKDANVLLETNVNLINGKFQCLDTKNCDCVIGNNLANGINGIEKDIKILKKWIHENIIIIINAKLYGKIGNIKQILDENNIKYQELKNDFIRI